MLSLVAASCAAMIAWAFIMAWRDVDVVVAAALGVVFFALAIPAISFMLAPL